MALLKASAVCVALIKEVEGLSFKPYHDGAGYMTVGYGHLLRENEPVEPITQDEANAYLAKDVADAEDIVNRLVKVSLEQHQFDAMVCFAFNIGETQFAKSGLLRELNLGHLNEVPRRLMMWNKHKVNGVLTPSEGLTNRRKKEVALWNGQS